MGADGTHGHWYTLGAKQACHPLPHPLVKASTQGCGQTGSECVHKALYSDVPTKAPAALSGSHPHCEYFNHSDSQQKWPTGDGVGPSGCLPTQAVGERGGPCHMALPIDHAALAARAQGPEWRGGAGQVQADVPEGVDGGGDAAGGKAGRKQGGRGIEVRPALLSPHPGAQGGQVAPVRMVGKRAAQARRSCCSLGFFEAR